MSGLRDRLAALADEWEREDDLTQWGSHHKSHCARQLRALLAEDETPATPEECTCGEFADTSVRYADCPVHGQPATPDDVDLAGYLRDWRQEPCEHNTFLGPLCCAPCLRDRLLASDWLADRLAAARREGADAALAPVEALREEWGWIKSDDPTPTRLDMYLNLGTAIVQGWDATGGAA